MALRNHLDELSEPGIYFITFTVLEWNHIFTSDKCCDLFYKWFNYQKVKYQNKIYAYVIMPNHFHAIFYVSEKSPPLFKLIQNGKRFLTYQIVEYLKEDSNDSILNIFSSHANIKKGSKHKVFIDGFDGKIIANEEIFFQKVNYIHNNPCQNRWNLSKIPEEYKYSSASNYILGNGTYRTDFIDF